MIGVLILGSKEYPFGSGKGGDPIPSGGMETYVNDLAGDLSALCRLKIVTRLFEGTPARESRGNIEVFRVPWKRGRWLRNPSFNLLSFLIALRARRGVDIVYSNGIVAGFFGYVLARMLRKKAVFRPAGICYSQYPQPLRQALFVMEKLVFRKSDALVFHSDGEEANARRAFGFRPEKAHVILTGFPIEKFRSGRQDRREEFGALGKVVITSVSRLVQVKGLNYLLEACSFAGGDFRLIIVGSGPEEKQLRAMASALGISGKVGFEGFRLDVPDILAITDIFVVSSVSEGLPTSLLEAMAAGAACIVTDIGLPIRHLKTGLVVAPRDSEALGNAIRVLMKNDALRKELGANASVFVAENCTPRMAAEKHLDMFRDVLGEMA